MSSEIATILDLLAERFGTTIEHLWEVMVRQAFVESLTSLIILLLTIALPFFLSKRWAEWWKETDSEAEGNAAAFIMTSLVVFIGCFLYSLTEFTSMITGFLNPEYWALKQILELLQ